MLATTSNRRVATRDWTLCAPGSAIGESRTATGRYARQVVQRTSQLPAVTRDMARVQSVQLSSVCSMKKLPPGTPGTNTIRIGESLIS
jgi:hypothetical protein